MLGKEGRGAAEAGGVLDRVDAVTVALSKSLASIGGAIMTSRAAADGIRASAMPYVFSAANDPASVGAALAALRILRSEPERVARLQDNCALLRRVLTENGAAPIPGDGAVIAVPTGADEVTGPAWKRAFDAGVYTNAVAYPGRPARARRAPADADGHAHRRAAAPGRRDHRRIGRGGPRRQRRARPPPRHRLTGASPVPRLAWTAMARRSRAPSAGHGPSWASSPPPRWPIRCSCAPSSCCSRSCSPSTSRRSCGWLALGLLCSVAFVAAVRWGAARRVVSPWLLLGLAPPALFELWLTWPLLTA